MTQKSAYLNLHYHLVFDKTFYHTYTKGINLEKNHPTKSGESFTKTQF